MNSMKETVDELERILETMKQDINHFKETVENNSDKVYWLKCLAYDKKRFEEQMYYLINEGM